MCKTMLILHNEIIIKFSRPCPARVHQTTGIREYSLPFAQALFVLQEEIAHPPYLHKNRICVRNNEFCIFGTSLMD